MKYLFPIADEAPEDFSHRTNTHLRWAARPGPGSAPRQPVAARRPPPHAPGSGFATSARRRARQRPPGPPPRPGRRARPAAGRRLLDAPAPPAQTHPRWPRHGPASASAPGPSPAVAGRPRAPPPAGPPDRPASAAWPPRPAPPAAGKGPARPGAGKEPPPVAAPRRWAARWRWCGRAPPLRNPLRRRGR